MSRKSLIAEILAIASPNFYDSGYRKALDPSKGILGGTRPLRLWVVNMDLDGYVLETVMALTEDGVVTDVHGGGCVQADYASFPIEDLKLLRDALVKTFQKEAA